MAFVRQGVRSIGTRGRSFFNVLTDAIRYFRYLMCADIQKQIKAQPRELANLKALLDLKDSIPTAHNENGFQIWSRQERAYQCEQILNSIGLSFQELLLHSQTMVVMHVHLVGQDLFVHAVSRAAHDFFVDAPFSIGGKRLRDLVC
jgi:hypothetical protein